MGDTLRTVGFVTADSSFHAATDRFYSRNNPYIHPLRYRWSIELTSCATDLSLERKIQLPCICRLGIVDQSIECSLHVRLPARSFLEFVTMQRSVIGRGLGAVLCWTCPMPSWSICRVCPTAYYQSSLRTPVVSETGGVNQWVVYRGYRNLKNVQSAYASRVFCLLFPATAVCLSLPQNGINFW